MGAQWERDSGLGRADWRLAVTQVEEELGRLAREALLREILIREILTGLEELRSEVARLDSAVHDLSFDALAREAAHDLNLSFDAPPATNPQVSGDVPGHTEGTTGDTGVTSEGDEP